jgi:hypothetical protein
MEKTIDITNIEGHSKIKFYSNDGAVDFFKIEEHISVYFDDLIIPEHDDYATKLISREQRLTNILELTIPENAKTAKIIITARDKDNSLKLIEAKVCV